MEIPNTIQQIISLLEQNGYQAYIVGGCVRDLLRSEKPNDWDITTNAKPEQIQAVFEKAGLKTFYENQFGTVSVLTENEDPTLKTIEITPFRIESTYSDKRHPDKIEFAKTLKEDLSRRDFTVNALALSKTEGMAIKTQNSKLNTQNYKTSIKNKEGKNTEDVEIIDLFTGQEDLKNKIIRTVGQPQKRFNEDGLRLIRAVRFAATLDSRNLWIIESKTERAIIKNSHLLSYISKERIRDELIKIIMSKQGAKAIEILRRLELLKYIMPELEQGFAITQNKHHIYQIYQHSLLSLNFACQKNFSLEVRLASLLHDIGKPITKKGEGPDATFYNHEVAGAKMAQYILQNLKFPRKIIEKVVKLVRCHLFYYNVGEVGESSVRRLLRKVGQGDVEALMQVRYADRIGSGVPKAEPYKLRHLKYLMEKVSQDPILPKMLKVNGDDVMRILNVPPGPKVGQILSYLLSQVLSYPEKNDLPYLEKEIAHLGKLSENELSELSKKARADVEKIETKRDNMTKAKYWVT